MFKSLLLPILQLKCETQTIAIQRVENPSLRNQGSEEAALNFLKGSKTIDFVWKTIATLLGLREPLVSTMTSGQRKNWLADIE